MSAPAPTASAPARAPVDPHADPADEERIARWLNGDWSHPATPAVQHHEEATRLPPLKTWRDTLWQNVWLVWIPALYIGYLLMDWWFTSSLPTLTDLGIIVGLTIINLVGAVWIFPYDKPAAKHHDPAHEPSLKDKAWSILRWCWLPFVWIPAFMILEPYIWHTYFPGQPDKAVLENYGTWWNLIMFPLALNVVVTWWLDKRASGHH